MKLYNFNLDFRNNKCLITASTRMPSIRKNVKRILITTIRVKSSGYVGISTLLLLSKIIIALDIVLECIQKFKGSYKITIVSLICS